MRTNRSLLTLTLAVICLMLFNSNLHAKNFKCMSLGGATGLINTPTANTGWEGTDIGVDAGFSAITADDGEYITRINLQLFSKWELGFAYDNQDGKHTNDWLMHTKFRFYGSGNSAIAIGGNMQILDEYSSTESDNEETYKIGQVYLAATYGGTFFTLPAETTVVIGKTFGESVPNTDIDFSMGFDLDMFPSMFKGYVHWINDFSNYSYQYKPHDFNNHRGIFSSGARVAFPIADRFKVNVDALLIDILDDTREFGVSIGGGIAI